MNTDPIEWEFGVPASQVDIDRIERERFGVQEKSWATYLTEFERNAPVTFSRYRNKYPANTSLNTLPMRYFLKELVGNPIFLSNGQPAPFERLSAKDYSNGVLATNDARIIFELDNAILRRQGGVQSIDQGRYEALKKKAGSLTPSAPPPKPIRASPPIEFLRPQPPPVKAVVAEAAEPNPDAFNLPARSEPVAMKSEPEPPEEPMAKLVRRGRPKKSKPSEAS